jgi:hypothetical protein
MDNKRIIKEANRNKFLAGILNESLDNTTSGDENTGDFEVKEFRFKVKHDNGVKKLKTKASSLEAAKKIIMNAEGCPEGALELVSEIKKNNRSSIKEDYDHWKATNPNDEIQDYEDEFDSRRGIEYAGEDTDGLPEYQYYTRMGWGIARLSGIYNYMTGGKSMWDLNNAWLSDDVLQSEDKLRTIVENEIGMSLDKAIERMVKDGVIGEYIYNNGYSDDGYEAYRNYGEWQPA